MNSHLSTHIDPALLAGNRKALAGYQARHFQWECIGGVATVTLNRPERKNPLTFDSYAELRNLFLPNPLALTAQRQELRLPPRVCGRGIAQ